MNGMLASNLGISVRTVEGHRQKILTLGRKIFPLNTFKDAVDVVAHLMAHDIV